MMELFCYFHKKSLIIDARLGSKYISDMPDYHFPEANCSAIMKDKGICFLKFLAFVHCFSHCPDISIVRKYL